MKASDFPPLPGWVTFPEAGAMLGVTKQAVHKMAEQGEFQTVRCVGQKLYVVSEEEINRLRGHRAERAEAKVVQRETRERETASKRESVPAQRSTDSDTQLVPLEDL